MATTSTRADVYYPESDGEPMGETIEHRDANIDLILALEDWFADDPLAYVSGDEFIYYVEGQPRASSRPTSGRPGDRQDDPPADLQDLAGRGKGPEFVVEVTSRSTRREDQGKKFRIYQDDLKVREYFLFDPLAEYLKPPCKATGWSRANTARSSRSPAGCRARSWACTWKPTADLVRLFDPATGRRLLNRLERMEAESQRPDARPTPRSAGRTRRSRRQEAAIQEKDAALRESEAEIERLRRELEALRSRQAEAEEAEVIGCNPWPDDSRPPPEAPGRASRCRSRW